ncbi:MAG TPA: hypothetical protein PKE31_15555 [Pseudomonadota bacterium]|nr:hypothetical protein [Pseudomonadota bacterium]
MRHSFADWLSHVVFSTGLLFCAGTCSFFGCSLDPRSDENYGSGDKPTIPEEDLCKGSETRCAGSALQKCSAGRFVNDRICAIGQLCDPKRGCLDCSPSLPTTCVGDKVHTCHSDGTVGEEKETCLPKSCFGGKCSSVCSPGSELIYTVDDRNRFFSFNPRDGKYEYKQIGTLSCPAGNSLGGGKANPFSMAVDRSTRAWVLYSSGEIFWVNTTDASCKPSGYARLQNGFETFGMGFVSDAEGSEAETLFVAGGSYSNQRVASLARIDSASLKLAKIAALNLSGQNSPELTGTGKGELYGFHPGSSPFVGQIDKTNASTLRRWTLPSMGGTPTGWAFAHWGGRFYIFITASVGAGERSMVWEFDPATGKAIEVKTNASYKIVGAGVSTCAPVIIG